MHVPFRGEDRRPLVAGQEHRVRDALHLGDERHRRVEAPVPQHGDAVLVASQQEPELVADQPVLLPVLVEEGHDGFAVTGEVGDGRQLQLLHGRGHGGHSTAAAGSAAGRRRGADTAVSAGQTGGSSWVKEVGTCSVSPPPWRRSRSAHRPAPSPRATPPPARHQRASTHRRRHPRQARHPRRRPHLRSESTRHHRGAHGHPRPDQRDRWTGPLSAGNNGDEDREIRYSETIRNSDGSCSGWDDQDSPVRTAGLENGAPVARSSTRTTKSSGPVGSSPASGSTRPRVATTGRASSATQATIEGAVAGFVPDQGRRPAPVGRGSRPDESRYVRLVRRLGGQP